MPGKYFEDFMVGARIHHSVGRTVTEMDNVLFCAITMNNQPMHLNEEHARASEYGRRIVNGIYTLGLVVGLSVPDLTEGTLVANLGYDHIVHPAPLFHGDTVTVETEVMDKRESRSKPDRGIVHLKHVGRKQDGTAVIEVERTVIVHKRQSGGANSQ